MYPERKEELWLLKTPIIMMWRNRFHIITGLFKIRDIHKKLSPHLLTSPSLCTYAKHHCFMRSISPHTSDPGSEILTSNQTQIQSQPTKTARKHPIKTTKTPFSPLTLPENPAIMAYAGFLSWRDGRVVEGAGLESPRWANKPSKYGASADGWHQRFAFWRAILMAEGARKSCHQVCEKPDGSLWGSGLFWWQGLLTE